MSDDAERAERLSRELDSAFRNRADLYRLMLDELTGELGGDRAEAIMIQAIERRGREVAQMAFAGFGPDDARAVGEAFLAVSPDGGRMYPTDVERSDDGIAFKVRRCPLKDAWVEADTLEQRRDCGWPCGAVGEAVDAQRIVEDTGHRGARVERGEWLLKHHLEARPEQPQRFAARGEQITVVEADRAVIGFDEPHDDAGKRRLAAARRPDQRQRFAGRQIERDVVERYDLAPAAAE